MPYVEPKRIKTYVAVDSHTERSGHISPHMIYLPDERTYEVERVINERKVYRYGVKVIEFKVRVHGKETYLYYENPRWYVEAKERRPKVYGDESGWIGNGAGL